MRIAPMVTMALLAAPGVAGAQSTQPRSADYLFAAAVSDARALWINPAGLRVVTEASIMGELVVDWSASDNARLNQWTIGFNAQGFGFAYQRDRHPDDPATGADESISTSVFRLGTGLPFRGGALGGSVSMNRGGIVGTQFGFDVGLTYFVTPRVPLAVVVRNLGRPVAHLAALPITGTLSAAWLPLRHVLEISAEASFAEGIGTSGWDAQYRGGASFSPSERIPVTLQTAADFSSSFGLNQWAIGISVGRDAKGVLVGSGAYRSGDVDFQRSSVTALVSRGAVRPNP